MNKNKYIKNDKQIKNNLFIRYKKLLAATAVTCMLSNIAGCGVLLYPERQGQKGGHIDVQVALLNGIGLVFFLVPGLVAFAIDFHQGTIYLPNTYSAVPGTQGFMPKAHSALLENNEGFAHDHGLHSIKLEGAINAQTVERVILEQAGVRIDLSAQNIRAQAISARQLGMISTIASFNHENAIINQFAIENIDNEKFDGGFVIANNKLIINNF